MEHCQNPWMKCSNTNIELNIQVEGKILPICSSCWSSCWKKIVETKEWCSVETKK